MTLVCVAYVDTHMFKPLNVKKRIGKSYGFIHWKKRSLNFSNLKKLWGIRELELFVAGVAEESSENVHYLGWIDREKPAKLYNQIDLFILPPYYEARGKGANL